MSKILPQKNSIKRTGFKLTDNGFHYKGQHLDFDEVVAISRHAQTINYHVPVVGSEKTNEIAISMKIADGRSLVVSEQSTSFYTAKQENVHLIEQAYITILHSSFANRISPFEKKIAQSNTFNWGNFVFDVNEKTIQCCKTKECFNRSDLIFFQRYGAILFKPKHEKLSFMTKFMRHFFGARKPNTLATIVNGDILYYLLDRYFDVKFR